MNVTESRVTKLTISGVKNRHDCTMDEIHVYLEDHGPRHGTLTIRHAGEAWTASWGGMGDCTIAEFLLSTNNAYVAKKLRRHDEQFTEPNGSALVKQMRCAVIEHRRDSTLDTDTARELWDEIDGFESDEGWLHIGAEEHKLLSNTLGDCWWEGLPTTISPQGELMDDILTHMRNGIEQWLHGSSEAAQTDA